MDGFCNSKKLTVRLILSIIISTILLLGVVVIPVSFAAWTADLDTDYAVNGVGIGHWTVAQQTYMITVEPCDNGTVTVSATEAEAGTEITLTVTPNSGYKLTALTWNGNDILNEQKFTMPSENVTVIATFESLATKPHGGVTTGLVIVGANGVQRGEEVELMGAGVLIANNLKYETGDIIYIYKSGQLWDVTIGGNIPWLEKVEGVAGAFRVTSGGTHSLNCAVNGILTSNN